MGGLEIIGKILENTRAEFLQSFKRNLGWWVGNPWIE